MQMELTADQKHKIKAIMAGMDCPKGFCCYESKFEDLTPVKAFPGNDVLECRRASQILCPMSFTFGIGKLFCKCPLRKYVALELSR
jgi:hypothetical protein